MTTNVTTRLKAGEWVEVRSEAEILATLDASGRLENLAFMPEMLQFCGRKFRVFKRADKTCDPAHEPWSIRRVEGCVHLEDVRCQGSAHGDCQAGCLIFWKEAWLKRSTPDVVPETTLTHTNGDSSQSALCTVDSLLASAQKADSSGEPVYSCQATELRNFTTAMSPWDVRQYIRDLSSGNVSSGLARDTRWGRLLELILGGMRLVYSLAVCAAREYIAYPAIQGTDTKVPVEVLNLQSGELVEVKSKEEIMATLDLNHRHRGLLFDAEMLPYCGNIYRVLRRVNHIVDERTGKMVHMKYPCIVLAGVVCRSDYHRLCPRAIYPYWRENWLKRAAATPSAQPVEQAVGACQKG